MIVADPVVGSRRRAANAVEIAHQVRRAERPEARARRKHKDRREVPFTLAHDPAVGAVRRSIGRALVESERRRQFTVGIGLLDEHDPVAVAAEQIGRAVD